MIGLGVSSIGDAGDAFAQNEKDLQRYQERIALGVKQLGVERPGQQRTAIVLNECFICAHARALAAGEDEGGDRGRAVHWAMIHGVDCG